MNRPLNCAKTISKSLGEDHSVFLEENNLHITFGAIYNALKVPFEDKNRVICYLIYAYDPESGWLNLKKNRLENKKEIFENLGANANSDLYSGILDNSNQIVSMCAFNFLESLKDWRWRMIYDLLDWASNNQKIASQETASSVKVKGDDAEGKAIEYNEPVDLETILKSNKLKGYLLDEAISKRRQADELLVEIRKEFVSTDNSTQQDFQFQLTDLAKTNKALSWREFVRQVHIPKMKQLSS